MRLRATVLIAVLAAACTQSQPKTDTAAMMVQWDSTAADEARAVVQKGFDAVAAMDLEGVKSILAQDVFLPTFDLDLENKPVRMATRDEATKYVEDTFAEVRKMNATVKVATKGIDCRATATFGVCTSEYDFSAAMADGKMMTQPSRITIALAKEADGWKWIHWHSSLSSAPPPAGGK